MKKYLNSRYLEKIFKANYSNLKTGTDKVTKRMFESNLQKEFNIIRNKCLNTTYAFTRPKKFSSRGRTFHIPTIRDQILIKLIRKVLDQKFNISYPDRDSIIELVINKLRNRRNSYVLRLDIKDFFPSIPHNFLLEEIKKNYRVSTIEYYLIKEFLKLKNGKGVPTGISLSSTLAEAYLLSLDQKLKNIHPRISHYFRYVDDILIIINGNLDKDEIRRLKRNVENCIKEKGLKINKNKYQGRNLNFKKNKQTNFNYLGYDFRVNNRKTYVSITDKKIKNIKGKIKFTFQEYKKNTNLELLFDRLNYLTCRNTMVKKNLKLSNHLNIVTQYNLVYHGIIETYKYVDMNQWADLDSYLQGNFYDVFRKEIKTDDKLKKRLFRNSFKKSIEVGLTNFFHLKDNTFFIDRLLKFKVNSNKKALDKLNRYELETKYRQTLNI